VSKGPPNNRPSPGESEQQESTTLHSIFLRPHYSQADLRKIVAESGLLKRTSDNSMDEDFACSLLRESLATAALNYRLASLTASEPTGRQWSASFVRLAAIANEVTNLVDEIEGQSPHSELSDALRDAARQQKELAPPGSLREAVEDRLGTSPTLIRPASEIHDLRLLWIREALEMLVEAANLAARKWASVGPIVIGNRHREEPATLLFVLLYDAYLQITGKPGLSSGGPFYRFASACVDLLTKEFPDLGMPKATSFRSLVTAARKRQAQKNLSKSTSKEP
jgi:hypothetical protein